MPTSEFLPNTAAATVANRDAVGAAGPQAHGFTFLQISDSHIGFDKAANPHAIDTLKEAIGKVKALP